MDFAITPSTGCGAGWEVVCLHEARAGEIAVPLASFGHRSHAEAFLADLVAMVENSRRVPADAGG